MFRLLFGDGSARGVAAMVVWALIVKNMDVLSADPAVEDMVLSVLRLNTNFEEHGDGSDRARLVAQAARQNQFAAVLPVNTIEWLSMVLQFTGLHLGATKENRATVLSNLEAMIGAYNELPDVDAYSEPAPKRSKRSKGAKVEEPDEGQDKGLKIGNRRLMAMRNFLNGGTFTGLSHIKEHLLWVSDYKFCVVNDDLMTKKWFFVGSHLPKSDLPSDEDLAKADAGAGPIPSGVPKGLSYEVMSHDSPLTAAQFDMMLKKAIMVYESETGHLERDEHKVRLRPSEERMPFTACPAPLCRLGACLPFPMCFPAGCCRRRLGCRTARSSRRGMRASARFQPKICRRRTTTCWRRPS